MKRIIYIFSLLTFSLNLLAQKNDSINLNAFEDIQLLNVWTFSDNPASNTYQPYQQILRSDINYNTTSGDFYKVMTPASAHTITFNTEGYKKVKNLNFYGKFKYHYGREYNLNYNNTLFVSPDNPFILADTIKGKDYTSEIYNLNGRVTYQTKNMRNIFSINFNYHSGNKYCETDPRADINSTKAIFNAGYIRSFSENWQIGGNFKFGCFSEEIEEEIIGNNTYYFFRPKGLGQYESYLVDDETTVLYDGYNTGLGIQIKYANKNIEYISEFEIQKEIESSQKGTTSSIYKTGDYTALHPTIKQLIRIKRDNINHDFALLLSYNKIKGKWFYQQQTIDNTGTTVYDVILEAIVYQKKKYKADLNYKFSKIENNRINHYLSLGTKLMWNKTDCYPNSYYEDIDNMNLYITGYKDFKFTQSELSVKIESSYQFNLSKSISVGETDLTNLITLPEYAYLSSNSVNFNGEIKYSIKDIGKNHLYPYVNLSGGYTQVTGSNDYYKGDNRINGNIGIGLFF